MDTTRRRNLHRIGGAAAMLALPARGVFAQAWPAKPPARSSAFRRAASST